MWGASARCMHLRRWWRSCLVFLFASCSFSCSCPAKPHKRHRNDLPHPKPSLKHATHIRVICRPNPLLPSKRRRPGPPTPILRDHFAPSSFLDLRAHYIFSLNDLSNTVHMPRHNAFRRASCGVWRWRRRQRRTVFLRVHLLDCASLLPNRVGSTLCYEC